MPSYITLNIIFLTTASVELKRRIEENEPVWDEPWKRKLEAEYRDLRQSGLDHANAAKSLLSVKAGLLLRLALERRQLPAFVRDPDFDREVRVEPEHWMSSADAEKLPLLFPLCHPFSVARADGDYLRTAMDEVYVWRSTFDTWMSKNGLVPKRAGAWRKNAVKQAISALWPDGEAGMYWQQRNDRINEWLSCNGYTKVSDATIKRAFEKVRAERALARPPR
ncbi:hypothetical protein V5279_36110 [Bradyrhizobium sp. 26S5]|uniref:hypothetical protein n=1 Tax=Bradyrhizobium sp. 26S5 TaxID=3139729 RepID=UPI0030D351D5